MRLVIKFGGASIASAADVASVAGFLRSASGGPNRVVGVCSAMDGTTDDLIRVSSLIRQEKKDDARRTADRIISRHKKAAEGSVKKAGARKRLLRGLERDFAELRSLVDGMSLLGEVTRRSSDHLLSFGERMSARIVSAAVSDLGARSSPFTGKEIGIVTDSNFGESKPLMDTTRLRVSKNMDGLFGEGLIPVVGGFAGADQHGHVTTLGRGGSDYTATIIGSCIGADEIWLMSNVDGMMTADPRIVGDARVIGEVSYAEAIEMALFGAKQIHPRTFEPVLSKKIPIRIRNAFNTEGPGTLVTGTPGSLAAKTVKCVSTIPNNGLIDIRGGSMVGSPGTAASIFATLARAGINVMMISQNPSESSITIVVKKTSLDRAVHALEVEHLGKVIKKLEVTSDVAIVALIGAGMRGTAGVASRALGAAASRRLNVVMITQGSSEVNLAFVVRDQDAEDAVRAIHDEFGLARIAGG